MVSCSSSLGNVNGGLLLHHPSSSNNQHSAKVIGWGPRRYVDSRPEILRGKGQVLCVSTDPNVTIASGKSRKEVLMVDPAEAKRLAAKQMETIKSKQSFERRRQIEAVNGAWAVLGLTAGVIIEGQTGNGILAQLAGYWAALTSLFGR